MATKKTKNGEPEGEIFLFGRVLYFAACTVFFWACREVSEGVVGPSGVADSGTASKAKTVAKKPATKTAVAKKAPAKKLVGAKKVGATTNVAAA
jgi:hypothetical protein